MGVATKLAVCLVTTYKVMISSDVGRTINIFLPHSQRNYNTVEFITRFCLIAARTYYTHTNVGERVISQKTLYYAITKQCINYYDLKTNCICGGLTVHNFFNHIVIVLLLSGKPICCTIECRISQKKIRKKIILNETIFKYFRSDAAATSSCGHYNDARYIIIRTAYRLYYNI